MAVHVLLNPELSSLSEPSPDAVEHGEVFTREWVVETILDLVIRLGYW